MGRGGDTFSGELSIGELTVTEHVSPSEENKKNPWPRHQGRLAPMLHFWPKPWTPKVRYFEIMLKFCFLTSKSVPLAATYLMGGSIPSACMFLVSIAPITPLLPSPCSQTYNSFTRRVKIENIIKYLHLITCSPNSFCFLWCVILNLRMSLKTFDGAHVRCSAFKGMPVPCNPEMDLFFAWQFLHI